MKHCFAKQWFAVLLLTFGVSGLASAASSKISPDLQNVDANSTVHVIVQYVQPPVTTPSQALSLKSLSLLGLGNLIESLPLVGSLVDQVLNIVNAVVYTVPASQLQVLAQDPNVTYISPDRPLAARLDYSTAAVNASAAWKSNRTGAGIGVAVIDSGISSSPDLAVLGLLSRVVYTQDFTGGNGADQYGHGTHVAGIIGANGISSSCFGCKRSLVGVAPGVSLINLRVLDANGSGSDSAVIAAIQQAITLKNRYNIRVINLSLGRPIYESYTKDPLCKAVEAAWKAGIVVVTAAGNDGRDNFVGNDGYGTIEAPGNDPYVITVGAMKAMETYSRTDDLIASYSSKGPSLIDHVVKPDLVAPGNHVVSLLSKGSTLSQDPANAVPLSYYQSTASSAPSPKFMMLNGTSMATPVVSGAVADILQGQSSLTPDQVKARLMKTAYKHFPASSTAVDPVTGQTFTSQYDVMTVGAGYLDIAAALANHDVAAGTALSPTARYDVSTGNVYLVCDLSSTWDDSDATSGGNVAGAKAVWGTQAVWGTDTVAADKAVWGTQAVWGTSSVEGFKAVWGTDTDSADKAVWGTQAVWGTKAVWGTQTVGGTKAVWGTDASTGDSDTNVTATQR